MKKVSSVLFVFYLFPINLFAWTNGELLIWMDPERGRALDPIVQKFDTDFGVKVTIETPEKITSSFPIAAQVGKGPDIVIWAHDKVGEWADGGLIAPLEISSSFVKSFFRTRGRPCSMKIGSAPDRPVTACFGMSGCKK
jgi:maltose-binding protein MalE